MNKPATQQTPSRAKTLTRRDQIKAANERARQALCSKPQSGKAGHLGDLAFWNTEPEWRMRCSDVHNFLQSRGLDATTIFPPPTSWAYAFGRAVDSVRAAIHSLGYTLLDAADGTKHERRVSVVKIARNGVVSTEDEGTVACPTSGLPYVERQDPGDITGKVLAKARDLFEVYTTQDMGKAIVTLFDRWAAMQCTRGVYFLPPNGSDEVEKLNAAMIDMGAGYISQFAGYEHDARTVQACTTAINLGLEAQLSKFSKEAEEYESNNGKLRATTVERSIEQAKYLKQQANLYRTILGAAVSSVDDKVEKIEQALRVTLGVVEARV